MSDFDGGMDLWYSSSEGHGGESGSGVVEDDSSGKEEDANDEGMDDGDGTGGGGEEKREGESSSGDGSGSISAPRDVKPSTGPHFTIHDATGQKYVCRVYAEDELIVLSRLDSAFHPAITVWDDDLSERHGVDAAPAVNAADRDGNDLVDILGLDPTKNDGIIKKFQFSLTGNSQDGSENGNLPDGIRSSVAKMLRKMGMNDAAEALAAGDNPNAQVEVIVAEMGGNQVANGGDNNAFADIIKAAAVGAQGIANNDKMKDKDKKSTVPTTPRRMNETEMYRLLQRLKGMCSQLHLGWWSYEWCHQEQVRQFHVAVSTKHPRYDVQDVTLVGKYGGEMEIIYPKGMYDGKFMKGRTTVVQYDNKGKVLTSEQRDHTPQDDAVYKSSFFPDVYDTTKHRASGQQEKSREKSSYVKLGQSGGPIITQVYEGGDFCEEVGYARRMTLELRCCTEDEIDQWLDSKKQRNQQQQQRNQQKDVTPPAVLVSVKEEETCVYRSRVCTPLLCPAVPSSAAKTDTAALKVGKTGEQDDPIGGLLNAIFGDEMVENGEVQVYFPDDIVGGEFDDLIAIAENGGDFANNPAFQRVKEALRKGHVSNTKKLIKDLLSDDLVSALGGNIGAASSSTRPAGVMEVKEQESIREILDKVMRKRPCLVKNLGW